MSKKYIVEARLLESGLSRIWQTMQEHDTGFVTAFRHEYKHAENIERNKALITDLRRYFDVTSVKGAYVENYGTPDAKTVGENVFFVSAPEDNRQLKAHLQQLGQKYEQDSVLYVPKGGQRGFLIGTKEGVWPGLGVENELANPVFGKAGEFFTTIKGRPFVFQNKVEEQLLRDGPKGFFGEWSRFLSTAKYWRKR